MFYGTKGCDPESDFYTSTQYFTHMIRGTSALGENDPGRLPGFINNKYPAPGENYDASMAQLRQTYQKPVFSFEVGQFEILPDFDELQDFQGVSDPANYRIIQEKVRQQGLEPVWKRYVEATGELSRIGYRAEVEAAMNTDEMSGISLLQLRDFPGQGTALEGMMDSHLKPKPFAFARPEAFQAFFRDRLVLASLPRYTYQAGESFTGEFFLANYGKTELSAPPGVHLDRPWRVPGRQPARPALPRRQAHAPGRGDVPAARLRAGPAPGAAPGGGRGGEHLSLVDVSPCGAPLPRLCVRDALL